MPSPQAMQYEIASAAATLTELLKIDYREGVPEMLHRYSTGVAKMIPEGRIINQAGPGDDDGGHMIRVQRSHSDSARASRDASKDYGRARKPRAGELKVRFDTLNSANNDLCRIEHIIELDLFNMKRAAGAPGVAIDIAENEIRNATLSVDEVTERLFHADATAVIGVVNGDKKAAATKYDGAGAYSSGSTSARILVSSHSIAMFKPGFHLDFHNASTGAKLLDEVEVMHVDEEEGSILIQKSDRTTLASNVDAVVTTALICRSGEYNQGFKGGLGNVFKTDYTNDSYFGGANRSNVDKMWLVPLRVRTTATDSVVMNADLMDQLANGISMRMGVDPTKPLQFLSGLKPINSWRRSAGDGVTSNRDQGNRDLVVGETGLSYVHPELGRIEIKGTKNARPDRGYLWDPQRFEMLYGEFKGFEWTSGVPGNIFRQQIGTNNTHGGGSIFYRAEGVMFAAPISVEIDSMAAVFGLK